MKQPLEQLFDFGRKQTPTPVKSLVKIRFHSHGIELAYYNDRFDLQPGDVVYVSGKRLAKPVWLLLSRPSSAFIQATTKKSLQSSI